MGARNWLAVGAITQEPHLIASPLEVGITELSDVPQARPLVGHAIESTVVRYTSDAAVAGKFVKAGTQIAAGVPFMIGEPSDTKTFRIGLFGIDKLKDPAATVGHLRRAMEAAVPTEPEKVAATKEPRDKARATTRTRANCCHPVNVTEDSNTRGRVHRSIATSMRMCVSVWKQ